MAPQRGMGIWDWGIVGLTEKYRTGGRYVFGKADQTKVVIKDVKMADMI